MLFLCICTDKPNSNSLRMATRPKHLEYIEGHKSKFQWGGPLLAEDGQTMIGSFFILDMPDRAAVEAHIANDPYTKAGLFESTVIRPHKKVLP